MKSSQEGELGVWENARAGNIIEIQFNKWDTTN